MAEVVGKSNDPVVQCESCRNLVKYVENDVEYTTKHFNKENIEFSKKSFVLAATWKSIWAMQNGFQVTVSKQNQD